MKILVTLTIAVTLASCISQQQTDEVISKTIHIPDSLGTFYSRQEYNDYKKLKTISAQLKLDSLENDTSSLEIRVWSLSSYFNPQSVRILKKRNGKYLLSLITFYVAPQNWETGKIDSIRPELRVQISSSDIEKLKIDSIWKLPSQSEMSNGDSFGCVDGSDLLLEMSNKVKYKYSFYRCPYILRERDKVFETIDIFSNKIGALFRQ